MMAIVQVALSLAVLVGGVLLKRTVANLYAVDTGVDEQNFVTLSLNARSREGDEANALREIVTSALRRTPGIEVTATSMYAPHGPQMFARARPGAMATEGDLIQVSVLPVTADWFRLLNVTSASGGPLSLTEEVWRSDEVAVTQALEG
jgi:hypothetical protein